MHVLENHRKASQSDPISAKLGLERDKNVLKVILMLDMRNVHEHGHETNANTQNKRLSSGSTRITKELKGGQQKRQVTLLELGKLAG